MKYAVIGGLVIWLGLLIGTVGVSAQTPNDPRFEPVPCPGPLAGLDQFECGTLTVPEDHQRPTGKTIRLMVAIAHSANPNPAPDPVLMLVGGPGNGVVGSNASSLVEQAILAQRDIIYLDQRGTGLSRPNLVCYESDLALYESADPESYLDRVRACRDRLQAEGVNLRAYTSAQSAADIAMLRDALGIKTWNLWGTSYGTRLALTVMRDHPAGIRSVVLDSVFPPNADPIADSPAIANTMFTKFFDACATDTLCNWLYPDLRGTFIALFEQLNAAPVHIQVDHPDDDAPIDFLLDGDALTLGTIQLMSDQAMVAFLPSIIYDFHHGDFSALDGLLRGLDGDGVRSGMAYSVICSEEVPFTSPEAVQAAAEPFSPAVRSTQPLSSAQLTFAICDEWLGDVDPDPKENDPVISDIPALLLVGEYDSATPPQWAHLAAETLPYGSVHEFPGLGHITLLGSACPIEIMVGFLDNPNAPPDAGCIDDMNEVAFVVTVRATRPWAQLSAGIFGILALLAIGITLWGAAQHPRQFGWRTSFRLMGWPPAIMTAGALIALPVLGDFSTEDILRMSEIVVPLGMALIIVFLFSPPDEPPLEILLVCPRRPVWLLLERLGVVFITLGVLAMAYGLVAMVAFRDSAWLLALTRWIPPALMLCGIAIYATLRSKVALFGVAVTLLVWFMLVFTGDALLPGQLAVYTLNYIQPFLWPFHPYLKPDSLARTDYVLNRFTVAAFGICLIALAARLLRDEESILLGQRQSDEVIKEG